MNKRRFHVVSLLTYCLIMFLSPTASAQDHAMWTDLGLFGGDVQDIAMDPQNPDRIFAATYQGRGLFLSEDGGAAWRALEMENAIEGEDTFNEHSVYAVAIAPSNSNIVWAAHNYWVAKSTDGGLTWTHMLNSSMQQNCATCAGAYDNWRYCRAIAIHPTNPDIVYIGTGGAWSSDAGGAVYGTTDAGLTWNKLNGGNNLDYGVEDLAISPDNPETVWAVTNSNGNGGTYDGTVYRSANSGQTFTPVQPKPVTGGIMAVAPKPDDADIVFVTGGYGIVQLTYDGAQWNASYPVAASIMATEVAFAPSDANTVYACWMHPVSWGGDGLSKVSRGVFDGSAWIWETFVPDPQIATYLHSLAVHPTNADIVMSGDQSSGALISRDHGQTWTPINEGLDAVIVYDVDVDDNQTGHMLAASGSGLFERPDGASPWIRRLNGIFRSAAFSPSAGTSYFGGGQGFVARTTDSGATWAYSNNLGYVYIGDIAVDPVDSNHVYITSGHYGRQVLRSLDGGATFTAVLNGVNQDGQAYSMNKVVVDPHNPMHLLAAGGNFRSPYVVGDLWQSPDGGDSWQRTGLSNEIVNAVLVDPFDPMLIYAGCGYSTNNSPPLFQSKDGGVTWAPRIDGLPTERIYIIDVWAASGQYAMAVGKYGTVIFFDGQSTTIMASGTTNHLYGIFGLSPSDVWAVGQGGLILHFDGTQWSPMNSGTSADLYDVWAAGPDQVMAVGANGLILRFDGSAWTAMDSGTAQRLNSLYGFNGSQVYAVGDNGTIIRYDGATWSPMNSNTTNTLMSVWGSDPDDLYAVGAGETALHYNGSAWSIIHTVDAGTVFSKIWGAAADNVYVTAGANGRVMHYDGATWSELAIPGARDTRGLWGSGASAVFVNDAYSGLFLFDGTGWTTLRTPGTIFRSVTDLAVHCTDNRVIYAATYKAGVFVSPNQADGWLNLGTPTNSVFAIASGSLYAATGSGMYALTGTGVIAGQVNDASTLLGINAARVTTDIGNQCLTIDGKYLMVVPAGIFNVFAVADLYELGTAEDVAVVGSDVTRCDFELNASIVTPGGNGAGSGPGNSSAGGGGYCFIGTLTP